ncbi:signal transduction histidine kinase [Isoptericola jiangsuensis]|uniref:histidine kinase n=1 Tax=Isoptericola jiangsuensis TaxID=548579 RepID=A0A2A9ET56_9MICO|nr:signal transduction histidine kinase [Isoptericola jiangsuensis]
MRTTGQVRPLPGGWVARVLLVLAFLGLVALDATGGTLELSSPRGVAELLLPYVPVLGLAIGPVPATAAWFVAFAAVLALGAQSLLVSAFAFPTILVIGFCTYLLPWVAAAVVAASAVATMPLVLVANPDGAVLAAGLAVLTLLAAVAGLTVNFFRLRSEHSETQVRELEERQARIRNEERTRLAHELHDIVAHDVTIIAMQARRAEFVADPDKTTAILDNIGRAAQQALQNLRSLVVLLKEDAPPTAVGVGPGDPAEPGASTVEALEMSGETTTAAAFVRDFHGVGDALERAGFTAHLTTTGAVSRVPTSLRQALRRTVRELGTNILKHGDAAAPVELRLTVGPDSVTLASTNVVATAAPISSSLTGLEAMRARCEVFGGELTAGAHDGRWRTTMTIPLDARVRPTTEGVPNA